MLRLRRIAAAAASGVMLAAAFPKLGLWPLVWVALVPLLWAARGARPRTAAVCGLVAGLVFLGILQRWVVVFDPTGWVLLTAWQGSYVLAFAAVVAMLSPSPVGWRGVLVPAAAWTALEWVRSLSRGGFTWGDLAYALHGQLPLVQIASLFGPLGITFLIVTVNAAVAAILAARGDAAERGPALRRMAWVALLLVAAWGWGARRLAQPLATGEAVRVAVLQGNVSGEGRDEAWPPEKIQESLRVYLEMTDEAARAGAKLIVWPETAVPSYPELDPELRAQLSEAARRLRVDMIVGGSHRAGDGTYRNSAFLFSREGRLAGRYDKVHLVPYGEYAPLRRQLGFLYRYFPIRGVDYSPGRGFYPLAAPSASVGAAICFESSFASIARALRHSGAEVLAILTNDAWFGHTSATWQHYHMSAFRAVESGSYLLRAATTGFSAIFDPHGRATSETPLYERRVLLGEVRRGPAATLYLRVGDVAGWGSALAVALLLAVQFRAGKRR